MALVSSSVGESAATTFCVKPNWEGNGVTIPVSVAQVANGIFYSITDLTI